MAPIDWIIIWEWIIIFLNFTFWQSFVSEIIAVFIGVIAALWVSNWNESRKSKNKKEKILDIIYRELHQNRNILSQWILKYQTDDDLNMKLGEHLDE